MCNHLVPHLPRKGTDHELRPKQVVMPILTPIQAAKQLKTELGEWTPRHYAWLSEYYPEGVREDQVREVAQRMAVAMSESNVLPFRRVG